ncbi:MAG: hypothetical protein JWP63_1670, partial [Candidatus Solibacter sp.]|nr:hypothetical protein [Candidatus Solibacter sp.]
MVRLHTSTATIVACGVLSAQALVNPLLPSG